MSGRSLFALTASLAITACSALDPAGPPSGESTLTDPFTGESTLTDPTAEPQGAGEPLSTDQGELLRRWYDAVGERRSDETFGALVERAAQVQRGVPYAKGTRHDYSPERLAIKLDSLVCVTLVQYALALADCTWMNERNEACFRDAVAGWRYRNGTITYANRLHYFEDWLLSQEARGRVRLVTRDLGGRPIQRRSQYISSHPRLFPAMQLEENRRAILDEEARLSATFFDYVPRQAIGAAEPKLHDGDIFAVVGHKRGLLVRHAGFVTRSPTGSAHILHSSSRRTGVTLETPTLGEYVRQRPRWKGLMLARPLPPPARTKVVLAPRTTDEPG